MISFLMLILLTNSNSKTVLCRNSGYFFSNPLLISVLSWVLGCFCTLSHNIQYRSLWEIWKLTSTPMSKRTYHHRESCNAAGVECGISGLLPVQHFVLGDEPIRITGLCPVQEDGISTSGPCCGHIHLLRLSLESKNGAPGAGGWALGVVGGHSVLIFSEWLEEVWGISKLRRPLGPDEDQQFVQGSSQASAR